MWTTGAAIACTVTSTTTGNLIVLQLLVDGNAVGDPALSSISGVSNLAGTANAMTALTIGGTARQSVGSVAGQLLWVGRSTAGGTVSVSVSVASGDDGYYRLYEFTGVNTGTTQADILENGTAGVMVPDGNTTATVQDVDVTTLDADRLACNWVAIDDDNPVAAFTGMTGGTWAEATAEFLSATGTDACIQLQTATIASAGTIGGGTQTMVASDGWGTIGFAFVPPTAATTSIPTVLFERKNPRRRTLQRM